ncbi:chemotaxis protein CheA [Lutispora thermophila]|uniref:Chemotaxis protein CheA n=1 Tax=Lutispora thermophila DSM 19022 TaxID=1122184 RepID=A0A1M6G857_9FIRM|nr:chemotaxis protein CheA [Lutispora thermophila]SHJ06118.1 two-component system, chemotaxis family, sensor kinase CheA [Lutispora thermophila DSM 19022]
MDINQYLEIFIEEAQDHLQHLNQNLLELESNPDDNDILNEIFRSAHTLKGMAGTMGFDSMMNLTHNMENILDAVRKGTLSISSGILDVLFECLDFLEDSVNYISETGKENEKSIEPLKKKLLNLMSNSINESDQPQSNDKNMDDFKFNQYDENVITQALAQGMKVYKIEVILSEGCMLKSARAFVVFKTLEKYAEIFKSLPAIEDIEDEKFDRSFKIALITNEDKEKIEKDLKNISEIQDIKIEQYKEIATVQNTSKTEVAATVEVSEDHDESEESHAKKNKVGKTVRVDINRLDNLMNLVSELIIIKTRLEGIDSDSRDQNMSEAVEYLERITTNLHDAVMKVRMVPIERVFNRFPRMVRDLSRELNKEVNLIISGEETELDRTVIDEIGDPLIHLIRNAIDHGIESKSERENSNKDTAGNIYLRAYQDGNSVVIEVEDDGKGINIDKIKKKALDNKLITQSEADGLSDKDATELIFHPGFSTADVISDISGRGVGLDVVKTKIESLGGTVEVESYKGKGSKFIIRLPLTLAIIQALLVTVGSEKYAIPLNSIKEIISIEKDKIRDIQGQEVILYRNSVLPILRLAEKLDVKDYNEDENELTVVVVKKGDKFSGFIVESLIGQQEIVIKSLGKYLAGIKNIAGATILGDGQVALIVDTNSMI